MSKMFISYAINEPSTSVMIGTSTDGEDVVWTPQEMMQTLGNGVGRIGRTILEDHDLDGIEEIDSEIIVEEIEEIVRRKCLTSEDNRKITLMSWKWIA